MRTIGNYAFPGISLSELVIPNSITALGAGAFMNITSLEELVIGLGVDAINDYTFKNTGELSIIIPATVTKVVLRHSEIQV